MKFYPYLLVLITVPFLVTAVCQPSNAAGIDELTEAARNGDIRTAEAVLATGIDVNMENSDKLVPIVYAAANDHVELLELLLRSGADPNAASSESGSTALHIAAQLGQVRSVKTLLDNGADINIQDDLGMTPLIKATYSCKTGVIAVLLKRKADVSIRDYRDETALMAAKRRYDTYVSLFSDSTNDQEGLRRNYREVLDLLLGFEGG